MKFFRKGFTLIELLVVIAIIGLLASIIMINLNAARNRAKNAAIKEAMSQLKSAAELSYYDSSNSYVNVCGVGGVATDLSTGGSFGLIRNSINANGVTTVANGTGRYCLDGTNGWCFEANDMPHNAEDFCVDYTGYAGSAVSCESTYFTCQ